MINETKTVAQSPTRELRNGVWDRMRTVLWHRYWHCENCQGECEVIVSDHGQPNKCGRCGSVRVHQVKAVCG